MDTLLVEAEGVVKTFGATTAVDGLDLDLRSGSLVAVLGPNGAGKTTFVRILATLCRPDRGTVRVLGHDVVTDAMAVRATIGLAGQHASVEPALDAIENLELVARLYGLDRRTAKRAAADVLDALGLDEVASRPVRTYSGGQRRRLDLGVSLVGAPRVLLLDEPTTGLDPRSRADLWAMIRALAARGTDVILTTQYLEEADQLADRVVVVDHGRVIADGSPIALKQRVGGNVVEVRVHDAAAVDRATAALGPDETTILDAPTRRLSVPARDGVDTLQLAATRLRDAGIAIDEIAYRTPTLDEVFLTLTDPTTRSDRSAA